MNNILLQTDYGTLHNCIPFDRLKNEDFEPAIMEGMRQEDEAINALKENPDAPTFENTILPRTDELLSRATDIFFNLLSANTCEAMDELAAKLSPLLAAHSNRIMLDSQLFERVKQVYNQHPALDTESQMLLDRVYEAFERNGATLNAEAKQRFSEIQVELSALVVKFNENNLKATNAFQLFIEDEQELSGLPDTALEAAALAAKEAGRRGWLFTLQAPSYNPFLTYADNRALRRKMYLARNTLCTAGSPFSNEEMVKRIVNLRRELAQLLGYKTFADYALSHRMAATRQRVDDFLGQLLKAYLPKARSEVTEVEAFARKLEGDEFQLQPWDMAYYSQKLRKERYDFDSEMLRPYFKLDNVKKGVFQLATRLYGIQFRRNREIPVFHPDVEAYEVFDEDGSFLAVLYADYHPRESKQSGAWMTSYQEQYRDDDGTDHRPHVSVTLNVTKPTDDKPALLTLGEVETFLHEFGHALHGIFSDVHYKPLSGTNVLWDFVELPSQLMENYAIEPDFLHTFAFHYKSGEPLSDELIQRVRESRNFQCGYACVRQLSFCMLDMAFYTMSTPFEGSVAEFEKRVWEPLQLLSQHAETCMSVQFSHIMSGGYAAGYYSYKWAEVLDADAFDCFLHEGLFSREVARRFRDCILSRGGSEPPATLYRRFRGKEATIDALLRRNGIQNEVKSE
ncbi:MAG: M3 family metallopeptidase [Bacteroidaceae bacterium]|nr:M3 family metallopeptidase [Bacteroidaceae bacterium]